MAVKDNLCTFVALDEFANIQGMPTSEIVQALGRRFRQYRLTTRFTQKEVAEQSGVSLLTIRRFELGYSYNITMGNFISMLKAIGYVDGMADVLPEIPVSPYLMAKLEKKKPKRVKHGKNSR